MSDAKAPCKNCDKREIGCHSSCRDYISYKEKADALREKINFEKAKHYGSRYFSDKKTITRKLERNKDFSV